MMKLWSRGLGTTELRMDCRYYTVKGNPGDDSIRIMGKITDPVSWEFRITLEPDDIPGMMKMFFHACVIRLALKNLYKYVIYLIDRRKYLDPAEEDIEEKVDRAYAEMMSGRQRPTHMRL
ncbi:hypothetical protein ACFL4G_05305 [Thermodesulfobacteriota bacterium]